MRWSRSAAETSGIIAIVVILLTSGAIVGIYVGHSNTLLHVLNLGDFYVYITLCALIGVWSFFGLYAVYKKSVSGIRHYMYGHVVLSLFQFVVGLIHMIVLFSLYRPRFMDACYDTDPNHLFWWSLGYDNANKHERTYVHCVDAWVRLAVQRTVTWLVYSIILAGMTLLIQWYRSDLSKKGESTIVGQEDPWPNEKGDLGHSESVPKTTSPPPAYKVREQVDLENQQQQRDRLYEEIHKRRNQPPQPQMQPPQPRISVHPLDLSDISSDVYVPPSPPPAHRLSTASGGSFMSSRSSGISVNPVSSEKADYDRFKSTHRSDSVTYLPSNFDSVLQNIDSSSLSRRHKTNWGAKRASKGSSTNSLVESGQEKRNENEDEDDSRDDECEPLVLESDDENDRPNERL